MARGAYVFGCEGPALTAGEAAFFRATDPWGFILFARNIVTPDQVRALTESLREAVGRDAPVLIDQEGGRVARMTAPVWREYLPALDQAVLTGTQAERAFFLRGALIGAELRDVGIDVNCAPLCDIARPDTHPILRNRLYGATPEDVTRHALALRGGQSAAGVASVLKHIPGHGRATVDSHLDLPRVGAPRDELERWDFAPFRALADTPMGMTAHLIFAEIDPDRPATQSPVMIDLIRREIGFQGLLMTDDISMQALSGDMRARSAASIAAGCDMILHCNGDMAEMKLVAETAGRFTAAATRRAARALDARNSRGSIDISAAREEFAQVLKG